ncbi:integrase family protein [Endozoicomonas sp. G2_1]|uniref:tyrosine-type recombinase/integrase n=1 Tax=Endozoicomonas sp. G2_1 TaxID=2821091 RepID=UPI001AD9E889|nr:integrase family protein [Endozoicomonas sp. G2_1]MBO9492059.1 integrase family protein [Endozoicomonas sp. G2_1]
MKITESRLNKLWQKEGKGCTIGDGNGLTVVVSPKGKIIFSLRFKWIDSPAKMKLGTYPAYSLDEARADTLQYKRMLEQGQDPRQHKKLKIRENQTAFTVKDGLQYWLDNYAKKNRKSDFDKLAPLFERYVYRHVGNLPLEKTTMQDWDQVFDNPALVKHPVQAGRLLGILQTALRFVNKKHKGECLVLESLKVNDVGKHPEKCDRYLLDHELGLLWRFVNEDTTLALHNNKRPMGRRNLLITKLIIAFGDRTGELRTAQKTDFDLMNGIWSVPDSKNKSTIIRPIHESLKPDIQALIDLYPDTGTLIPPSDKPHSREPVSGQSLVGIPVTINKRLCLDKWNMHDLRRTIDTHMAKLGIDDVVTEKILGHKLKGIKGNYQKHDYIAEQLEAYNTWINYLDGLWQQNIDGNGKQ